MVDIFLLPVGHFVEMLGELCEIWAPLLALLLRPQKNLWDLYFHEKFGVQESHLLRKLLRFEVQQ
jgi:hypothetical protein